MSEPIKIGTDHSSQLTRMRKIEGQVRGISKMIENQKYCVDILTQIKAVSSALRSVEIAVLEGHVNHCLISAVDSGSKTEVSEKVEEIMDILKRTRIS